MFQVDNPDLQLRGEDPDFAVYIGRLADQERAALSAEFRRSVVCRGPFRR